MTKSFPEIRSFSKQPLRGFRRNREGRKRKERSGNGSVAAKRGAGRQAGRLIMQPPKGLNFFVLRPGEYPFYLLLKVLLLHAHSYISFHFLERSLFFFSSLEWGCLLLAVCCLLLATCCFWFAWSGRGLVVHNTAYLKIPFYSFLIN